MNAEEAGALEGGPRARDDAPVDDDDAHDLTAPPPALDAAQYARFRAMFDAHYDAVYRLARRSGLDVAAAEDGAQQVFLVAMRRLDAIELGKERSFLCGTAVRVAARLRSQRAGRAERERSVEGEHGRRSSPPSPDELLDQKRRRELLDELLAELEEDLRVVLVLAEIDGLGKREIAEALGIPEGTAASRLRRAREDFATRLKRRLARGEP